MDSDSTAPTDDVQLAGSVGIASSAREISNAKRNTGRDRAAGAQHAAAPSPLSTQNTMSAADSPEGTRLFQTEWKQMNEKIIGVHNRAARLLENSKDGKTSQRSVRQLSTMASQKLASATTNTTTMTSGKNPSKASTDGSGAAEKGAPLTHSWPQRKMSTREQDQAARWRVAKPTTSAFSPLRQRVQEEAAVVQRDVATSTRFVVLSSRGRTHNTNTDPTSPPNAQEAEDNVQPGDAYDLDLDDKKEEEKEEEQDTDPSSLAYALRATPGPADFVDASHNAFDAAALENTLAQATKSIGAVEERWSEEMQLCAGSYPQIRRFASEKGIIVPYEHYASLLDEVRVAVRRAYDTYIRVANGRTRSSKAARSTDDASLLIWSDSVFALPRPLFIVDTALSISVLWRMLFQAQDTLPAFSTALTLFTTRILPHVYSNFDAVRPVLPSLGTLCGQVQLLAMQPLRSVSLAVETNKASLGAAEVNHLRVCLGKWVFGVWKRNIAVKRRQRVVFHQLNDVLVRHRHRVVMVRVLTAWRLESRRGIVERAQGMALQQFHDLTGSAKHAARNHVTLAAMTSRSDEQHESEHMNPPTQSYQVVEGAAADETPDPLWREFIAQQLMRTATHEKGSSAQPSKLASREADPQSTLGVSSATQTAPGSTSSGEPVYSALLSKIQEVEDISGYLRAQLAIQSAMIDKLEKEKKQIYERTSRVEQDLIACLNDKMEQCNLVQEKELRIREQTRQIMRLKARVRAHRIRPWQRTLMRVVGDVMGVSTRATEMEDERSIVTAAKSSQATAAVATATQRSAAATPANAGISMVSRGAGAGDARVNASDRGVGVQQYPDTDEDMQVDAASAGMDDLKGMDYISNLNSLSEEQRVFGALAPIVLASTKDMPDSFTILRDWANGCLQTLVELGVHDNANKRSSLRFETFTGSEVSDGVLLSRLVYFLALPRYGPMPGKRIAEQTYPEEEENNKSTVDGALIYANAADGGNARSSEKTHKRARLLATARQRRRQLLRQEDVHLDSPFPTLEDSFGDFSILQPRERISVLLQFVTDLMEGIDLADAEVDPLLKAIKDKAFSSSETLAETPAARVELFEVIDAQAMAKGERWAVMTFVSLLYVRFAHPFHHKSAASVARERDAMVYLLSQGGTTYAQYCEQRKNGRDCKLDDEHSRDLEQADFGNGSITSRLVDESPLARDLMDYLEEEDKSPWLLFQEKCAPLIASLAQPYVLRGAFWSASAFESAELGSILGALGLALLRSLEMHRWHITISCLVPVSSYSGLSRGVFTGPRASPSAFVYELTKTGEWKAPLRGRPLLALFHRRWKTTQDLVSEGIIDGAMIGDTEFAADQFITPHTVADSLLMSKLVSSIGFILHDLIVLYLERCELSIECSTPVMSLNSWRLLCADIGVVQLSDTEVEEEGEDMEENPASSPKSEAQQGTSSTVGPTTTMEEVTRFFSSAASAADGSAAYDMTAADASFANMQSDSTKTQRAANTSLQLSVASGIPGNEGVDLPEFVSYLSFGGFVAALVMLADAIFPPVAPVEPGSSQRSTAPLPLGDALRKLFQVFVDANITSETPDAVLLRLTSGAKTQSVLQHYSTQLQLVYQLYAREVDGTTAMKLEDASRMLRDCPLASSDVSPSLVTELFGHCSVRQSQLITAFSQRQTNADRAPRDAVESTRASPESPQAQHDTRITVEGPESPTASNEGTGSAGNKSPRSPAYGGTRGRARNYLSHHEKPILLFDGFVQLLCALCAFQQPNPFTPFAHRLQNFLRRSVLRPLSLKHEPLSRMMTQQRYRQKKGGTTSGGGATEQNATK